MVKLTPKFIQELLTLPRHVWTEYDDTADILYISFCKPHGANDSVLEDDGKIYHYHDDELVGITVMNASKTGFPAAG